MLGNGARGGGQERRVSTAVGSFAAMAERKNEGNSEDGENTNTNGAGDIGQAHDEVEDGGERGSDAHRDDAAAEWGRRCGSSGRHPASRRGGKLDGCLRELVAFRLEEVIVGERDSRVAGDTANFMHGGVRRRVVGVRFIFDGNTRTWRGPGG